VGLRSIRALYYAPVKGRRELSVSMPFGVSAKDVPPRRKGNRGTYKRGDSETLPQPGLKEDAARHKLAGKKKKGAFFSL